MSSQESSKHEQQPDQTPEVESNLNYSLILGSEESVRAAATRLVEFADSVSTRYSLSVRDIQLLTSLLPHQEQLQDEQLWSNLSQQLTRKSLIEPTQLNPAGLEKLYHQRLFRYRPHYNHLSQHSAYTCGVASYLMAANIFDGSLKPSKRAEIETFHRLADPETHLISTTALIEDAVNHGLHVRIHSEHDYDSLTFDNKLAEQLRQDHVQTITRLAETGLVENNTGVNIDSTYLRQSLLEGEMLLMNGTTPTGIPHMRLIGGYHGDSFIVSDPLEHRALPQPPAIVETMIEAPLGKFGFSVSTKHFDFYQINVNS